MYCLLETHYLNTQIGYMVILLSGKYQNKDFNRDKEGHLLLTKLIYQEDLIVVIIYAPYNRVSKYMKPKLIELQGEIDELPTILRDFNTPFSKIDLKMYTGIRRCK